MRIPLPFPRCPKCKKESPRSYHKLCNGTLEIDVNDDEVHCNNCQKHWNIWRSNYYCSCGHCFSAHEVRATLCEVLAACEIVAQNINAQIDEKNKRKNLAGESLRTFILGFFEGLGYAFATSLHVIVDAAMRFIRG